MEQLKEILKQTLAKSGLSQIEHLALIKEQWLDLVGNEVALHCQPVKLKKGILYIEVTSPVWAHRLSLTKLQIKEKLNPLIKVSDLRFQLSASK